MNALGLSSGTAAHAYIDKEDAERMVISDARAHESTREGRMARRQHHMDLLKAADTTEGPSYSLGIDDTISSLKWRSPPTPFWRSLGTGGCTSIFCMIEDQK
ncbi:hypothetical protein TNIN_486551 [Trichonephila inaurata madagascariensis]|uniref:Uncharacterized protein n=1 Tax=Trichonephila inaurata madagascariensis TaxID=2747483 RepID=A0A8X6Y6P7_9ARAC|nr:hypothetical protein TNIN_486551 [Trichonephila inaurata madagascariensis]